MLCAILTRSDMPRWRDSLSLWNRAIAVSAHTTAFLNRGVALAEAGKHRQAIADLDRAIELYPASAKAYFNRGCAYSALDGPDAAIRDFTRAIELKPGYAEAYNNRGIELATAGAAVAARGTGLAPGGN